MAGDSRILVRPTPPDDAPVHAPMIWSPCSTCWGQRQTWHRTPEGYVPHACPECMGMGEVTS